MDAASETPHTMRSATGWEALLAGLQGGMVGALWMLGWFGLSDAWRHRTFWNAENLFATAFYGDAALSGGFTSKTLVGAALYLLVYSSLGAAFGAALRNEARPVRVLLLSLAVALVWYYASFHWLWKTAIPLAALLEPERPAILGHLIYGTWLSRFRVYLGANAG